MASKDGMRKRGANQSGDASRNDGGGAASAAADAEEAAKRSSADTAAQQSNAISSFFSKVGSLFGRLFRSLGGSSVREVPPTSAETLTALEFLTGKAGTKYNGDSVDHESMLKELWDLLMPSTDFERISKANWESIGFQGKDPATDFRGQGLLGLHNLLYLAQNYTEQSRTMLEKEHGGFPLALASINISAFLTQLVKKNGGLIGNPLFVDEGLDVFRVTSIFSEFFSLIFLDFESQYSKEVASYLGNGGNPAFVIMQFNPIREKFFKELEAKVGTASFDENFIAQAKERSKEAVAKRAVDTEEPTNASRGGLHLGSADAASKGAANAKGGTVEGNLI